MGQVQYCNQVRVRPGLSTHRTVEFLGGHTPTLTEVHAGAVRDIKAASLPRHDRRPGGGPA